MALYAKSLTYQVPEDSRRSLDALAKAFAPAAKSVLPPLPLPKTRLLARVFALVELLDLGRHVGDEPDAIAPALALQDPHRLVGLRGLRVLLSALRRVAFVALRADLIGDDIGRIFLRRSSEDPCPGQRGQRRKQKKHVLSHRGFHCFAY